MGKALQLINGIPRMAQVSQTAAIYDQTYIVGVGGLPANTVLTLPSTGQYRDIDLRVFLGGQFLEPTIDYTYVGAGPLRTQITVLDPLVDAEKVRFRINLTADPLLIYDRTIVVGAGGISAGTSISLPNSTTYEDVELEVYLDGQFLEPTIDYNYVGASTPRSQIQLTFDILQGERLRLRKGD